MSAAFYALSAVLLLPVAATLLPLSGRSHWIFRIFDFPRLQIAALNLLAGTAAVCTLPSAAALAVAAANLSACFIKSKKSPPIRAWAKKKSCITGAKQTPAQFR